MKTLKGFTIIELLVVIAIIAVLAAVVMVNVTGYINKGKDAAIQANLASVMTNAAVAIDAGTAMSAVCAYPTIGDALTAAGKAYDPAVAANTITACNNSTVGWAACAELKNSDSYFCVDSTGAKKTIGTRTGCTQAAWTAAANVTCP